MRPRAKVSRSASSGRDRLGARGQDLDSEGVISDLSPRVSSDRDRRLEQTAELAREVHRDAGVHRALPVKEALRAAQPEHALVPDVGMDVEPTVARETEAD